MASNLTYLTLTTIFSSSVILTAVIFGYHLFKPYFGILWKVAVTAVIITPLYENAALALQAWEYNPARHLGIIIFGIPLESYVFAALVSLSVAFPTLAWTFYEDQGEPILTSTLHDILKGTYAIWRKNKTRQTANHNSLLNS